MNTVPKPILAASVCWIILAALLTFVAVPSAECTNEVLPCLALNEWGDFFAGVFAPLAFLWLVAAVMVQSKELAEQREELRLTRQEFEHNRKVMEAQADEARKQAEFIGVQTDILKAQEQDRQEERVAKELDEITSEISDVIKQRINNRHSLFLSKSSESGYRQHLFARKADDEDAWIILFSRFLESALEEERRVVAASSFLDEIRTLNQLVTSAIERATELQRSYVSARLGLPSILTSLGSIIENTEEFLREAEARKERDVAT